MENDEIKTVSQPPLVPYVAFESIVDRYYRMQVRLMIVIMIALLTIAGMGISIYLVNRSWLKTWSEYDYTSESTETVVDVDGGERGMASYIGGNGDIINGKDTGN